MPHGFKVIQPTAIEDNVFRLIGEDWMLVTAGPPSDFNTMTASWGGLGELWRRQVAFVFIRPQRYTFGFMEAENTFTLSFFTKQYHDALNYCGTHSGRDVDKMAATGLTPLPCPSGAVAFAEARLILDCRKLYAQDLAAHHFIVPAMDTEIYPRHNYHRFYVGEVTHCLMK